VNSLQKPRTAPLSTRLAWNLLEYRFSLIKGLIRFPFRFFWPPSARGLDQQRAKLPEMNKTRLEAFSDAVIAIIMTIMVLELKIPHGDDLSVLIPQWPIFLTYTLSFIYCGIYWNNHHHMLHATQHISGGVLWANLHLLFWLSLIPFATGWMGENNFAPLPTAIYGVVLILCAAAYTILQRSILRHHEEENALLAEAVGNDLKGKASVALYAVAIPLAFVNTWVSQGIYFLVAAIWFIPDRRIEKRLPHKD
jgi:uncharacterized membrane protein